MANGRNEANHTLTTEIQMLFNTDGAEKLQGQINSISDGVRNMTGPIQALTEAFGKLGKSPLSDLVRTLENFSIDSVTTDARDLKRVLENKIATAISKSKIEFIGDEGTERYPFKVKMGREFWEKNYKKVAEAMATSFTNFEIDPSEIPPLDNRAIIEEFQKKFNEQIVELIKDEDIFSLYRYDSKDKVKKYRYKRKFKLDEKAVGEIIGAIEKEFINVLSDPDNIVLEEIPKLKIKSTELKQAMLKIQESIGDIDSLLGVEADALKDLPNIEEKLVKFRENLGKMVEEINRLAGQLESITIGKATEEDVKQALKSINNLKDNVIVKINKWIEDITLDIDSHLDIKPDLGLFKENIQKLNDYIDVVFQRQLEQFQKDIDKVLNNLQAEGDGRKKDVLEGKKIDITQAILDVITDNLLQSEIPIELDMGLIDEVVRQWAIDFHNALTEELDITLKSMVKYFTELFEYIDIRIDGILYQTNKDITAILNDDESLFDVKELKRLLQSIQQEIYGYVINTLSDTVKVDYRGQKIEFELPKSFTRDVKRLVDSNIREYTQRIIDNYKARESEGIEDSIEKLNRHTSMLINAVMREVNQTLTDIRKEFLHRDTGWAESTQNLKATFDRNIRALTTSYMEVLENSINTIILTEDSLTYLQEQVSNQIVKSINITEIEVDKRDVTVKLDDAYREVVKLLIAELEDAVESWMPESIRGEVGELFSTSAIIEKLQVKIDKVISDYLNALDIGGRIGGGQLDTEAVVSLDLTSSIQKANILDLINRIITGVEDVVKSQIDLIVNQLRGTVASIKEIGLSEIDIREVVKELDSIIQEILLNRLTKLSLEQISGEGLKINLTTPIIKALKEMEKVIKTVVDEAIDSVREAEVEKIDLNIKTKRLQNNINSLIQKIINEKSKQITALGNQLASETGIDETAIVRLKEGLMEIVDHVIAGYYIATERFSSGLYNSEEISTIYQKMVNGITESFTVVVDSFVQELNATSVEGFSIATSALHPRIRKALADYFGMGVKEFKEIVPEIKGDTATQFLIQKNIELVVEAVNKVIHSSIGEVVRSYEESVKKIEVEPSNTLFEYIRDKLQELQNTILATAKRMVREQFKFLTEEIKQMNIEAKSLGYKPTKAFTREVARATGGRGEVVTVGTSIHNALDRADIRVNAATMSGTDIIAHGLEVEGSSINIPDIDQIRTNASSVVVDGQVVDLNIDRLPVDKIAVPIRNLLEGLPFNVDPDITPYLSNVLRDITAQHLSPENVFKRGYTPFNLDKIFFRQQIEPRKGIFEGITSNMAKYFMVGYMMRLPIKAVTEASRIAEKLDYHIAKARQNILIKDPDMTSTARRIVYDRYQAEGLDVRTEEFRRDVEKEAANLRNIMSNQMSDYLLNISKAYYQDIADVGRYYSIVSRRATDPYEALTKTREIAKIAAVEEDLDTDFAALGLDAMAAQWGITTGELSRYTNMLLKTAMLSNVTVTDLLMAQRDTAGMFRRRLSSLGDEEAFAAAMALSSMFVQATGKTGREAGTFWRNVLNRPYVKDSRKFLEEVSQIEGFEMLSPYETDELGRRVQKDFVTMFSNILEATLKVDDPSAMTILSELFPIRTIGGAESINALVEDLRKDLERSIEILKDMGELDEDATIDTVNIKEVIEKYIENIMEVTDRDIGMYLAGLQDTVDYARTGLTTQWQSTVYSIFRELKEETTAAMTYLTAILRKFEENSHFMSEVIGLFFKIGVGILGENLIDKIIRKGLEAPRGVTDVQREMVSKYLELQATEKSLDLRKAALESTLEDHRINLNEVEKTLTNLQAERDELQAAIQELGRKDKLTFEERKAYVDAEVQLDLYNAQIAGLSNTYNQLQKEIADLTTKLNNVTRRYTETIEFGRFIQGSLGARNVEELKDSLANLLREEELYIKVAPLAIKSVLGHDTTWYKSIFTRKAEVEGILLAQQRRLYERFKEVQNVTSKSDLENILGEGFGDVFYALEQRVDDKTLMAMDRMTRYMEFDKEYAKMKKQFDSTYKELNAINSEILNLNTERLEVERAIFEAERDKVVGYMRVDDVQIPITEPRPPREIAERYRGLLPAFGININEFESGMDKLAAMFKDGKFNVDEYESSLKEVAKQLGIADKDFENFKITIRELNNEIRSGSRAIFEYLAALEAASTRSGRISAGAMVGGQVGSEQSSSGLDTIGKTAIGVSALSLMGKEAGKKGLFGKLFSWLGATKLGAGLSKLGTTKLGALVKGSTVGALGKGLAVGLKGLLLKIPKYAIIAAIVTALSSIASGLTEKGMTDAERLSLEADKLEKQINAATGWQIREEDGVLRRGVKTIAAYTGGVVRGVFNQINRLAGGTAPSFTETLRIRREALQHPELTRDELRTKLLEQYEVTLKRAEANFMRQQELLEKNPFIDPVTGELRKLDDPYLQMMPLEELIDFLDRRMNDLNKILTESDALFTKEKVRLLVSGISNNSSEMRKATQDYLDKNISEMTRIVNELKDYLPMLVPGTETYTALQLQIHDLETRIAEAELRKFETDFSEFDEIMEKYNRDLSEIQSRYDIKKYDAILSGIHRDSTAIKQIEKRMATEQVRMITGIQNRLEELKQRYTDRPEQRERILLQIQQLEADKKRILADIRDRMTEGLSTFNLPSEIQPMTYYEAMTRNNTHRNVTIRAGEASVNITIKNMTGSKEDLERLGRVVSNAVAQTQKNFVRQFANDVKSGMGRNYYSWNTY